MLFKIILKLKSSTLLFLQFPPQRGTQEALTVCLFSGQPEAPPVGDGGSQEGPWVPNLLLYHNKSLELQHVETFMMLSIYSIAGEIISFQQ